MHPGRFLHDAATGRDGSGHHWSTMRSTGRRSGKVWQQASRWNDDRYGDCVCEATWREHVDEDRYWS